MSDLLSRYDALCREQRASTALRGTLTLDGVRYQCTVREGPSDIECLRHAVAFHDIVFCVGGTGRHDMRKVNLEAASRGVDLVVRALVRVLREAAPRSTK